MPETSRRRPPARAPRCLAALLLAALPAAAAQAQGFVPDPVTAEVRTLNKCLDVPDESPADQIPLKIFSCHGRANQRWLVRFDLSGFVILESEQTHKCLDVPNTSTVQQFRCHGGDNQRWQLFEDPDTLRFRLRPKLHRERCLHVRDDDLLDLVACDTTAGAAILSPGRWERQNFEIRLLSAFGGFRPLINEERQGCLDVAGLRQDDAAPIQHHPCNGGGNQSWSVTRQPDGLFLLEAQHSHKCLQAASGGGTRGVAQATCNGNQDRQKWHLQLKSTGRVQIQTRQPQCHLLPGPNSVPPRSACECLDAPSSGQVLRVVSCTTAADRWRLGTGRRAPGALTFFEDNRLGGDRLCGLPPAAGEYRFGQTPARACENDEARSLLLYEIAAGTVIDVFDDGRCRTTDDHTRITVRRSVVRYELGSFERGFEDEFLRVERLTSGNLDGKVSCVRIQTP